MIKANELRRGNKFQSFGGTMIQTVFEIIDNTSRGKINQPGYEVLIIPEENKNQYKPIEIEGIPLTEEWLVKFGFNGWDKGFYTMNLSNHSFEFLCEDGLIVLNRNIKYVHQLQNLYFALTGEELTTKTPKSAII